MLLGRVKDFTRAFTAPEGWDEKKYGRVGTLFVRDEIKSTGNQMVSAWYPTVQELERLNAGAPVHLVILGKQHPPVRIDVGMPADRVRIWPRLTGIMHRVANVVSLQFAGDPTVEQIDMLWLVIDGNKPNSRPKEQA